METNKKKVLKALKKKRESLKRTVEFEVDYLEEKKIELETVEMCIQELEKNK